MAREVPSEIKLRVLGYQEDGEWVALALEMDLRGYGETFQGALVELRDLVATQLSFADFKSQPELIWKDAAPVYFTLYEKASSERLHALARHVQPSDLDTELAEMPLPDPQVIAAMKSSFERGDGA